MVHFDHNTKGLSVELTKFQRSIDLRLRFRDAGVSVKQTSAIEEHSMLNSNQTAAADGNPSGRL